MPIAANSKALDEYYQRLTELHGQGATYEQATRAAFQMLLTALAQPQAKWTLVPELPLSNGKKPDATLRDEFNLPRGYWEAKDTADDLDAEIKKKIAIGYPTINTIFEDTQRAVLYQGGRVAMEVALANRLDLALLLNTFFGYKEPHIESFEQAVTEFRERIPELARGLLARIKDEHAAHNPAFRDAWASFYALCRDSLDPNLNADAVDDMLVQHLLTERLFRTIFDNDEFTSRNVIAAEIEKVIHALTSRAFNRKEFLKTLDRFYIAIEQAARDLPGWSEKQAFMNAVYERFFQGYDVKRADTHGIVYTPQEIVDFMCASVEEVLRREFGRSLSDEGVQILDPATGTGNFIVNLLRRISGTTLEHKYKHDLFANEIMLLPYYIASLNIEHEYYQRTGQYLAFDGLCFADTLDMAERVAHKGLGERSLWLTEANSVRVEREKDAQIMVVIGNPPYNVGQQNENDNNKNRKYEVIDERIRESYITASRATLRSQLYDAYVRFFRWASDRLQGRDGVVCYVSNNSFVDQIAFDGMRKHLLQDFTQIYHVDLHGNVRKNPKISGTTHNVFGIQIGVGITIAVRSAQHEEGVLHYHRVPEDWRREQKTGYLRERESISGVEWQVLQPDDNSNWLTEGMRPEFGEFLSLGSKAARAGVSPEGHTVFATYTHGVHTARDQVVFDFNSGALASRVEQFIEDYNAEISRWARAGRPADIDTFVRYDKVKWSRNLKRDLKREHYGAYGEHRIQKSLCHPFTKKWLYYAGLLVDELGAHGAFLPPASPRMEERNEVLCVPGIGNRRDSGCLVTDAIANMDLAFEKAQCFPLYTYDEDGGNRRENVTDWALARFQAAYGGDVTRRDIFHYVYAILHHPVYRERYAENLKRELPRIPLLPARAEYEACVRIGAALATLHLTYEQAEEYPLALRETPGERPDWRVKKMRLTPDKTALIYNDWLTLDGIPPEIFAYRLGNRSALDWVIDQYQVSEDKRTGIVSDPNRAEDPRYIVRLVRQVVTVSVETVRLVGELATGVDLLAAVGVDVLTP